MIGGVMLNPVVRRVAFVLLLGLVAVVSAGLMEASASAAKPTTLRFYSVEQTLTWTDAAGQPIPIPPAPTVGERYDSTDLYYAGDHKHHSSGFSASDHLACTITSASSQTCDGQIAIGSSLLLMNHVTLSTSGLTVSAPISAGTGKYKNAQGTFSTTNVGTTKNADNKIALTG